jgi:uncharacterized protein (TIGR03435 family)
MRNMRLTACIRWAYTYRIFRFPAPVGLARSGLHQRQGRYAREEVELRLMMRTLLAERFKLTCIAKTRRCPR